jgi:hypothetical protein
MNPPTPETEERAVQLGLIAKAVSGMAIMFNENMSRERWKRGNFHKHFKAMWDTYFIGEAERTAIIQQYTIYRLGDSNVSTTE